MTKSAELSEHRWRSGLLLALTTSILWGSVPLAVKISLTEVDSYTLAFTRFFLAFLLSWSWLVQSGQAGEFSRVLRRLSGRSRVTLVLASLALTGNCLGFLAGVRLAGPACSQIFVQIAPLLFGLASVLVFRERLSKSQILGVLLLGTGLLCIYRVRTSDSSLPTQHFTVGCLILLLAALSWACYALLQKLLAPALEPKFTMTAIYLVAAVSLGPLAEPSALFEVSGTALSAIFYCGLNTVLAYAAFTESTRRWASSRVGAVLPLTPVFTLLMLPLGVKIWPQYLSLESVPVLGVSLVVLGSLLAALGRSSSTSRVTGGGSGVSGTKRLL